MSSVDLEQLLQDVKMLIDSASEVEHLKATVFGRDGLIAKAMNNAKSLPIESRGNVLQRIQEIKKLAQQMSDAKFAVNKEQFIDVTLPTHPQTGKMHLLSFAIHEIRHIMYDQGFVEIDGPIIDDEEHNFDALNVSTLHPARGTHDTFYLNCGKLLRTHTSNTQIYALKRGISIPSANFHIGPAYRRDDDSTHSPMFHQCEGLVLGKVTIAHLKNQLARFIRTFFDNDSIELRFRQGFFPFTEPSIEVDMLCHIVDNRLIPGPGPNQRWMEVLGSGMVRRNILDRYGYDDVNGFAFGMGVERLIMLKYNTSNIQDLYNNRFPFLHNFSIHPNQIFARGL